MASPGKRLRNEDHCQGTPKRPRITIIAGQSCDIEVVGEQSRASICHDTSGYSSFSSDHDSIDAPEPGPPDRSSTPKPAETPVPPELPENLAFERHGLGRGIDSTRKNPWKHRTPHQLRKVTSSNISENDDGNHICHFSSLIESRWAFQSKVEASITTPKIPIRAGVAADFGRSANSKRIVRGETIHKRTIILKNTDKSECEFAKDIERELKDKEGSAAVEHCCEILQSKYGGITHYISSITLGAMKFSVEESTSKEISGGVEASAGVEKVASVKAKAHAKATDCNTLTYSQKIGRMQEENRVLQEGVVQYECTPITALIQDEKLHGQVTKAVRLYMRQRKIQKKGISGPYYIHFIDGKKKLYWKVVSEDGGDKVIKATDIKKNCSEFYIEKDNDGTGAEFMITTSEDGEVTEYPKDPHYVQLIKIKGKYKLKVGPLARKDTKVLFKVYDPKGEEADWIPDDQSKEGKKCYLQSKSGLSPVKKFAQRFHDDKFCLHLNVNAPVPCKDSEIKIELKPTKNSTMFALTEP